MSLTRMIRDIRKQAFRWRPSFKRCMSRTCGDLITKSHSFKMNAGLQRVGVGVGTSNIFFLCRYQATLLAVSAIHDIEDVSIAKIYVESLVM